MSFDSVAELISAKLYPALLVVFFFGLTIFIHELGHFVVARWCGMKVERFSIGFGPKIIGWKRRGIDYRISWFPFGGYVALPQMSPMDTIEGKTESRPDELPPAAPLDKIQVAVAGPIMNVLLAVLLASLVWLIGLPTPVNPSVVGWVDPKSSEEAAGIRSGDRIVEVNHTPVSTWAEIHRIVALSRESTAQVVIERAEQRQEYNLAAERDPMLGVKTLNLFSEGRPVAGDMKPDSPAARAGVRPGDEFLAVNGVPVGTREELINLIKDKPNQELKLRVMRGDNVLVLTAVPEMDNRAHVARIGVTLIDKLEYRMERPGPTPFAQFREIFGMMRDTFYALLHSKDTGVGPSSLSGPVGIMGGWWYEIKQGGIMRGVWFAVLLNLNLAILNLLPLPVLDGGHIVFALLERVRRKPLNARLVQQLSVAFAVLLIGFMLYVTVFDVQRFFSFHRSGDATNTNAPAPAELPPPTAAPAPAAAP